MRCILHCMHLFCMELNCCTTNMHFISRILIFLLYSPVHSEQTSSDHNQPSEANWRSHHLRFKTAYSTHAYLLPHFWICILFLMSLHTPPELNSSLWTLILKTPKKGLCNYIQNIYLFHSTPLILSTTISCFSLCILFAQH